MLPVSSHIPSRDFGRQQSLPLTSQAGVSRIIATGSISSRETVSSPEFSEPSYYEILGSIKDHVLGRFANGQVMTRQGRLHFGGKVYYVHILCWTRALSVAITLVERL